MSADTIEGEVSARGRHVAIVAARFNDLIVASLLKGARAAWHDHRQLEGAGNAHHGEILCRAAALVPGSPRALQQTRDDEVVEARSDDRHAAVARTRLLLDETGSAHPSAPT